jgi:hypothetical protein
MIVMMISKTLLSCSYIPGLPSCAPVSTSPYIISTDHNEAGACILGAARNCNRMTSCTHEHEPHHRIPSFSTLAHRTGCGVLSTPLTVTEVLMARMGRGDVALATG